MIASRDFYEALGYLSYVVAGADSDIEKDELLRLGKILLSEFGGSDMQTKGIRAISRFEMLVAELPPVSEAYSKSIEMLKNAKPELLEFQDKILEVISKIANSDSDFEITEQNWIEKFREDLTIILNE